MATYIYTCSGTTGTSTAFTLPRTDSGTCEHGQGAWVLYEAPLMTVELIQLGLAGLCVCCVALGWIGGSQR